MFETIMFLSVLAAVLFFGVLISIGNERQRKAIDGIREQAARWAETDIRLKRAKHAASPLQVRAVHGDVEVAGFVESVFHQVGPWKMAEGADNAVLEHHVHLFPGVPKRKPETKHTADRIPVRSYVGYNADNICRID